MLIGVTGGIGSGKSTVVSFFEKWGAQVINVDKLGWIVLEKKQEEIRKAFGNTIFKGDKIDRKKLGRIIFENDKKKEILNSIVHPPLIRKLKKQLVTHNPQLTTPLIVDCALIYEWDIKSWFDKTILVTSDYGNKIQRLINSGYTQEEAKNRIHAQLPDSEKIADWTIENNNDFRALEQTAKKIWNKIITSQTQ